ncbi:MAG: hypothetical protein RIS35_2060 [Pseudomonadota bacterium]|jgi:dimethylhistidine N-methyltransferase
MPRTRPPAVPLTGAFAPDTARLADEAVSGLRAEAAELSPKFLYDALGSRLFEAITELPEYYLTRVEARILSDRLPEIAARFRADGLEFRTLIDLGAGNCAKAPALFDAFAPRRYVAVDIATGFLADALERLRRAYPDIGMHGVGLDFSERLELPEGIADRPALVFYPGSSIGNFAPAQARRLLREAREHAGCGGLLIGVDLLKPVAMLEAAYDDALGVTAAFNLNLLSNVNRLAGTDFDVRQWRHVARFDAAASRIEMHLEAREAVEVRLPDGPRRFRAGERIHTENSYKWTTEAFEALLRDAGYRRVHAWTDPERLFGVFACSG